VTVDAKRAVRGFLGAWIGALESAGVRER